MISTIKNFSKGSVILSSIMCFLFISINLNAQNLDLPAKSPNAKTGYTIGYTDIEINYSRPAVRERNIWGNLVPYGAVWRAGANEATTISFSTDINIEGTEIPAGKYALFIIPQKEEAWEIIFNREHKQWGAFNYDESKDQARVSVKMKPSNVNQERLAYEIVDQSMEQGYIKFAWGKARIYIRFFVDVVDQGLANVDAAIETAEASQKWIVMAQGAEFLLSIDKQINQAMEWVEESTKLKSTSYNWWVKAQVLAKKELYKEAISTGKNALEIGQKNNGDKYFKMNENGMRNMMKGWVQIVENGI